MNRDRTVLIAEIALTIALAAVLNAAKIWRMPNAGTVSFVMLPIIVLALRRGPVVGVLAGALYGLVDFWIDPFPPLTWLQPLLDYPVAYALVGLSGLVSSSWKRSLAAGSNTKSVALIIAACAIGAAGRYLAHTVSGVVFFAEYAPKGQPVIVYSLLYNLYVPISAALAALAAVVLLPALERAIPAAKSVGLRKEGAQS